MKNKVYTILPFLLFFFIQTGFGQWVETNNTLTASFLNSGVAYNGKVYFTGGPQTQNVTIAVYNKKVEVLDLETGTITQAGEISVGRCAMSAVAYNGKIYFLGGHKWTSSTTAGIITYDNVDIYDIATGTWTLQHLSLSRSSASAAVVAGKIIFAGGWHATGTLVTPSDVVDIYDPSTGLWTVEHLSLARGEMLEAGVVGNKAYICGGGTNWANFACTKVVDVYDASLDTWSTTELSLARMVPSVIGVDKYLICAGGYTQTIGKTDNVDILDTETGIWSTHTLSEPRSVMATAALGKKAYFTGGGNLNIATSFFNQTSKAVDIFDAETGNWSTSSLTKNRMAHACAAWGNKIVVGGGWRAEQSQTTGSVEILTDPTIVPVKNLSTEPILSVYPNPASDILHVSFSADNQHTTALVVSDLVGRILLKKTYAHDDLNQEISLNLNKFSPGEYMLMVEMEGNIRIFRPFAVIR